jgi:hypothetical protein
VTHPPAASRAFLLWSRDISLAMVPIPESTILVAIALFEHAERTQDDHRRAHLGASEVGEECLRKIWYSFRWAAEGKRDGRMVRLLRRGKVEEQLMLQDLRDLGYQVEAGETLRVREVGGHYGGTPDGGVTGIPAAPKKRHILELKTSNDANWKKLSKEGVKEAQPAHYVQMQVYMLGNRIDRALYLSINKDDDTIYEERVELNQVEAQRFVERARRVIESQTVPERISNDPDWYQCRGMCRHHAICHQQTLPDRHCRTCLHVTPETTGENGSWRCSKWNIYLSERDQKAGCTEHLYLPSLLWWLQQTDATDSEVIYRKADGTTWKDSPDERRRQGPIDRPAGLPAQ